MDLWLGTYLNILFSHNIIPNFVLNRLSNRFQIFNQYNNTIMESKLVKHFRVPGAWLNNSFNFSLVLVTGLKNSIYFFPGSVFQV